MTHLDSSTLATYNSLVDPHLQCYFSNERIRSHLKHAGLISRRGEIVTNSEYRLKLARRDHKKHVRQMLAENIVHRAIDMERARQAELRRQLDIVAKAALVNSVKESRRRIGYSTGNVQDMGGQSLHSSWSQTRPRSASHRHEIEILNEELINQPRVQSAHVHNDQRRKYQSKSPIRRSRYLSRPKVSNVQRSLPTQRPRSPTKLSEPPCQIKMIYYGPHTKIDYDHSLFEPVDEIMVMQQHCGGENLIVYKDYLKAGQEFQFNSRRHSDYPFGLSLYVKGLIDSRISTCCEYKHRHGVRLGGERGHFAIISVEGSKPCLKCRFEKQSRLKQYEESNDIDDETKKPITISIAVSDQPKSKQTPVKIPVRHTSDSNENYSEDFDDSEKQKLDHSRSKSPSETSSISTLKSDEKSSTKTWQIIFHTSNIPTGSFNLPKKSSLNPLLKISFLSNNGEDETEQYIIQMKDFPQCFKSSRQDSFPVKLQNLGKPKQIRLKIEITEEDSNEDIKWHLDHIEVIDPETQSHYKFPCNKWIRPFEEKLLNYSDFIRKNSNSTNNSKSSSSIRKKQSTTMKVSSRSSSSSYEYPNRIELIKKPINNQIRRISTDNESTVPNKIHYRIIIYPSNDADGEFNASNDSRIFLRLNNQIKETFLFKKGTKYCPSFDSGDNQTFEIDLRQNINEQPVKLTIGYYNADISAGKWKLEKIVLINTETGEETIFPCKQSLVRNDFNLRAEQTFQAQAKQSDDDEQSTPRNGTAPTHIRSGSQSDKDAKQKPVPPAKFNHNRSDSSEDAKQEPVQSVKLSDDRSDSDDDDAKQEPVQSVKLSHYRPDSDDDAKHKPVQLVKLSDDQSDSDEDAKQEPVQSVKLSHVRPDSDEDIQKKADEVPPIQSYNRSVSSESNEKPIVKDEKLALPHPKNDDSEDDDNSDNEYNRMFNKNESNLSSSRPKTRRGRQDNFNKDTEQENTTTDGQKNSDIWRPSSGLNKNEPVDPLIGLDDIQDQTARSNDQKNSNNIENHFKEWYPKNDDDDEDDDNKD